MFAQLFILLGTNRTAFVIGNVVLFLKRYPIMWLDVPLGGVRPFCWDKISPQKLIIDVSSWKEMRPFLAEAIQQFNQNESEELLNEFVLKSVYNGLQQQAMLHGIHDCLV
jgi:hypothetical protein